MDRQAKATADFVSEDLHLLGLYPFPAGHAQGQSDYDFRHLVLANNLVQLGKIRALISPVEGFQSLRGNAQRIGNGEPDSF